MCGETVRLRRHSRTRGQGQVGGYLAILQSFRRVSKTETHTWKEGLNTLQTEGQQRTTNCTWKRGVCVVQVIFLL